MNVEYLLIILYELVKCINKKGCPFSGSLFLCFENIIYIIYLIIKSIPTI